MKIFLMSILLISIYESNPKLKDKNSLSLPSNSTPEFFEILNSDLKEDDSDNKNLNFILYFYEYGNDCDTFEFLENVKNIKVLCIKYFNFKEENIITKMHDYYYFTVKKTNENINKAINEIIKKFPNIKNKNINVYAKGIGAIVSRAYFSSNLHKENKLKIKKFITIRSPNMGFLKLKDSKFFTTLLGFLFFFPKDNYFKFMKANESINKSHDYLLYLNNIKKNEDFPHAKDFFLNLNLFISFSFKKDKVIYPETSPEFDYYENGKLINLDNKNHILIKDDKLGLNKWKDNKKRLLLISDSDDLNKKEKILIEKNLEDFTNKIYREEDIKIPNKKEEDSNESKEEDSKESKEEDSKESKEEDSKESKKKNSQKSKKKEEDSKESKEEDSKESKEDDSNESKKKNSQKSNKKKEKSKKSKEEDSKESKEEDSNESKEEDSNESNKDEDSKESKEEDSKESKKEDSKESKEEDSKESKEEDSKESKEDDSNESKEDDSNESNKKKEKSKESKEEDSKESNKKVEKSIDSNKKTNSKKKIRILKLIY